jgi:soluble lytic murein transglycosylase
MWALAQRLEDRQHSAEASALYQRLAGAFPTHEKAEDSLWQAGWLQYGQQRYAAAAEIFRRFEAQFPRSELLPQVLYWQARAVHHHGQPRSAERLYRRLVVDYPFHYYSLHAAERLRQAASSAPLPAEPPPLITVWAHPQPVHLPEPSSAPPSEPQFHLIRIRELQQLWMYQEAAREIRRLGTLLPDIPAARYLLGVLFVDNRQYLAAFRLLSSLLKDLRPEEVRGLPREFWTMLYPKAFWDNVARHAQGSGVDPYLILSIMRQESAFEPTAVSSAGARGLMQLMPETARLVSNRLNLRQATTSALEVPTLNIALGTHYFASLLQRYQGNVVLALAAYNAGPGRADRWHKQWQHLPMDEFVEQLPWRETRLYVKLVLRNLRNYERLYKALQDS